MENQTEKSSPYAIYALALLMFVYILNFLDRTIIYILFPLIKKEMEFSDTQLALFSIPFWLLVILTDNLYLILIANGFLLFFALAWLGAAAADVTEIAGINLRGLGIAIFFFNVNIAAYLIGSNLIGFLSDKFGATENPAMLRYALLVYPVSCLLSAVFLFIGSKTLKENEL